MGKLPTICAALVSLLAMIPPARAAEVLTLDIQRTCRGIANHAQGPGERGGPDLTFNQCVRSELQVRHKLAERWARFSAAEKAQCFAETKVLGVPSYTDVLICLEMARAARRIGFRPPPSIEQ